MSWISKFSSVFKRRTASESIPVEAKSPLTPGYVGRSPTEDRFMDREALSGGTVVRYEQDQGGEEFAEVGRTALSIRSPESNALDMAEQQDQETEHINVWNKGDVILGRYEVLDVKEGGMGYVYIVEHNDWHVKMAIKSPKQMMFSDKLLFARVLREANAWINLGLHPHIAYCYYVRQIDDVPYIFTEYLDGGSLREWITDMRCYELKMGLDLAIQFCHGMDYANKHGMIHRDIKPENIMMTKEGVLKVTDFGLVRTQKVKKSRMRTATSYRKQEVIDGKLTQFSTIMGSADYMSPEQWVDPQNVDPRTDIFAFGVCLYEMLCGIKPYKSASIEANRKHKKPVDPVKFRADIPPSLANLLKKSVALERKDRYRSFEELRHELLMIYRQLFHEDAPHAELETLALRADGLNNRAVSYAELGREKEAIELWIAALKENPQHLEAIYNRGIVLWRHGQLTDKELVEQLTLGRSNESEVKASTYPEERGSGALPGSPRRWTANHLLALVHLERGDVKSAMPLLEEMPEEIEVQSTPGLAQSVLASPNTGFEYLHTFEICAHQASEKLDTGMSTPVEVNLICLSSDGCHVLLGSGNELQLWNVITGECLRTFEEHVDEVICTDLSPNNRYMLSGSRDRTMRLWDVDSGKCLRIFRGHRTPISSVSISSDGCYALSRRGSENQGDAVQLWDLSTGECLKTYWDSVAAVTSICLSSDGHYALSASGKKSIRLWEVPSGKYLHTFEGHTGEVNSISLNDDGHYALSGSTDETMRLWDTTTGRCLRTFKGHKDKVTSVCLGGDARYALSGSRDKTMRLWEVSTGRCLRTFEEHTDEVSSVRLSADGHYALSGSEDKTIRIWKLSLGNTPVFPLRLSRSRSKAELVQVEAQAKELLDRGEKALEDGRYTDALALVREVRELPGYEYAKQSMELWAKLSRVCRRPGLRMTRPVMTFKEHTGAVASVSLSMDGRHALSGSSDRTVRLWNTEKGARPTSNQGNVGQASGKSLSKRGNAGASAPAALTPAVQRMSMRDRVISVSLSADGNYALSGSEDGVSQVWNMATGECLHTLQGHSGPLYSVCLSADGRYALTGSRDSTIRLWEVETGKCLRVYKGHIGAVYTVTLSADGRYAMSGGLDKTMRLWSLATGQCLHTFRGHTGVLHSVDLSNDGRYAISGSRDNTMRLWEVSKEGLSTPSRQCLRIFEGHTDEVSSVCLSADGRYALSGSFDSTARVWDVTTGECLHILREHKDSVTSVCLSADGRYALTGSMDRSVLLWEMDWELEARESADWDEEARVYLESFLTFHTGSIGNVERGKPTWTEEDFQELIRQLQYSGYGWLRPEGVRRELKEMMLKGAPLSGRRVRKE